MMRPLQDKPRGPRRVFQKLWADKDLRDELIRQLEVQVGSDVPWTVDIRIHASRDGAMAVKLANVAHGKPA